MPPYFYHLAFQLYSQPPVIGQEPLTRPARIDDCLEVLKLERGSFTPLARRATGASFERPPARKDLIRGQLKRRKEPRERSDTPSDESRSAAITAVTSPNDEDFETEDITKDWRYGKVEVDSIDMEHNHHGADVSRESHDLMSFDTSMQGKYVPTSPRTSEVGWGVVHLFRDSHPLTEKPGHKFSAIGHESEYVDKNCTTLCILAVPSYMTPSDLLGWLGETTREEVSHLRLVRTGRANRYMVLMKFRDSDVCNMWQKEWNGKLFNSMEPENCHVVFLRSILFETPDGKKDPSSFPDMSRDPFTPTGQLQSIISAIPSITTNEPTSRPSTSLTSKPAPPPTPALVELPTCPVCLERMDETTGLATIFCQHVFHCACLQKWTGSGCPVCRYTQNDQSHSHKCKADLDGKECRSCGATSNLWICLICGNLGCGRYDEAHAFAHFEQTSHAFAMDIATQHVWDYAGDGYVHRLIQNKSDGKLVELPSALHNEAKSYAENEFPEKMELMSMEYTSLLTSQLDSQRMYFEEQVERAVDKATKASVSVEQAATSAQKAAQQTESLKASHDSLIKETLPTLEREKERAERRADRFETMARTMEKEWREKDVINESLMDRIAHLEKQISEATIKNCDLEEQNRDLSFFISGMEKLKDQGEDVQEGSVIVGEAPQPSKKKKSGRGRR